MKTIIRNASLRLLEAVGPEPRTALSITGQTVEVHKAGPQAIIGIDGHTSAWDERVQIHWEGSHLAQLEGISMVEIRNRDMKLMEYLPVDGSRHPYEKDGDTVFFLTEAE